MRISDYLVADFIVTRLAARDIDGIVREVSAKAADAGVGPEDVIAEKLLERERSHPTVMGGGLAIPHATVPGLPRPVVGIAVTDEPVEFGREELGPVRVFFVLLSPPGHAKDHVKLLARICRLGRHENFLERIEESGSGEEIVRVVESIDAQHA